MKKKDKNETLIGLVIQSETSKAIYYWNRKEQIAEVIIGNIGRRKGMKVPLRESDIGIKDDEIIVMKIAVDSCKRNS